MREDDEDTYGRIVLDNGGPVPSASDSKCDESTIRRRMSGSFKATPSMHFRLEHVSRSYGHLTGPHVRDILRDARDMGIDTGNVGPEFRRIIAEMRAIRLRELGRDA